MNKSALCVYATLGCMLFAGCHKENDELINNNEETVISEPIEEMVEISANISNTTTRLVHIDDPENHKIKVVWEKGTSESFSLVYGTQGCLNFIKSSIEEAINATFTGKAHTFEKSTNLFGIYPAVSRFSSSDGVVFDFTDQDGSISDLKNHDYMTFVKEDFAGKVEDIIPSFTQKIAALKLTLNFEGLTGGTATKIGLSAKNLDTKVTYFPETDSYKSLATGNVMASGQYTIGSDGSIEAVFLAMYPQAIREAKIVATIGSDIYEATLSDNTLQAGRTYTINKTMKKTTSNGFENENISGIDGSSDIKAYEINNAAQLLLLADRIQNKKKNSKGKLYESRHYKLTSSIDLSTIAQEWTPISSFSGTFDGNGYVISNLKIDGKSDSQGFFSSVVDGTITNLTVNGTVKGNNNVGGLAGTVFNGTISNCVCNVEVEAQGNYAGGLVGYNQFSNTIENCHTSGSVTGHGDYVGGLSGNNFVGSITACYSECDVISTEKDAYVGGIAGGNGGSVIGCYSTGNVMGNNAYVGGIIGYNRMLGSVYACYSKGNVGDSQSTCGGIIGYNSSLLYDDCYYMGNASKNIGNRLISTGKVNDITTKITDLNKTWKNKDSNREYQFDESGAIVKI